MSDSFDIKKPEHAVAYFVRRGDLKIDDSGRVWRVRRKVGGNYPKIIDVKPTRADRLLPNGRRQIQVYINGCRFVCSSYRLIWYLSNGDIPDGYHIHHINGDIQDNRLENLEILEGKEHTSNHSKEYQRGKYDEYEKDRERTWSLWKSGLTQDEVARQLGIKTIGVRLRLQRYREDHNIPGRNHKANMRKVLTNNGLPQTS